MIKHKISAILLSLILSASMLPANIPANEVAEGTTAEAGTEASENTSYKITLPAGQEGLLVQASDSTSVAPGGSFTFFVAAAEGWKKGQKFSVKAGEQVLKPVPVKKNTNPSADAGQKEDGSAASGTPAADASKDTANAAGAGTEQQGAASGENAQAGGGGNSALTPEQLEKALTAKGYEKYVIADVRGNLTVTITGLEKDPAASSNAAAKSQNKADSEETGQDNLPEVPEEDEQDADAPAQDPEIPAEDEQDIPAQDPEVPAEDEQNTPAQDPETSVETGQENAPGTDSEDAAPVQESLAEATQENSSAEQENLSNTVEEVSPQADSSYDTVSEYPSYDADTGDTSDNSSSVASTGSTDNTAAENNDDSSSEGSTDDSSEEGVTSESAADVEDDTESIESYSIWVGGVQANSENQTDLFGDGTVSYDDKNHILTLEEAVITGHSAVSAPIYYTGTKTLTIDFTDSCTVSDSSADSGILCENSSLVLDGTGTLTVRTASPLSKASIQVDNGGITVSGGTVTAVSSGSGAGMLAKTISVTDDAAKVRAESAKIAMSAKSKITIGDLMGISTPENGKISSKGTTITDENGKTAAKVVIDPLPVYEVSFEPGEGTGTMSSEHVVEGQKLDLPKCDFNAPKCKVFSSWKADGTAYDPGDSITVTKDMTVTAQWKDSHTLQKIAQKAPTCLNSGNIEYYKCSVCRNCFSDSSASTKIDESSTIVKATGHKWGTPTYTWASDNSTVTAKRVCQNDSSHIETETVRTTKTGTDPTCEEKGKYKYTAVFSNTGFIKQIKNVTTEALGHKWEKYEFDWDQEDDGSWYAECKFTCTRDTSHKKTVDTDVTSTVTLPNKSSNGKIVCTASTSFNGKTYTDKIEKTISPAGSSGYKFSDSSNSWTLKSGKSLYFKVKRSSYNLITYKAFSHITIDGKTVNSSDYSVSEGSLKLKIHSGYLDTLAVGTHKLVIEFKDGNITKEFTVKEAASKTSPVTGDDNNLILWMLSFAACAAVITGLIAARRSAGSKSR